MSVRAPFAYGENTAARVEMPALLFVSLFPRGKVPGLPRT